MDSGTKLWIDPPAGWRYGFPKVWDQAEQPDFYKWLLSSGYPQHMLDEYGDYFYCKQWAATEEQQ